MSEDHLKAAQRLLGRADGAAVLTTDSKHLSMEDPTEAADPSAPTFSQVVFMDIPKSYPPSTPVTCSYTFAAAFQPNPRDWVGIFKVGWTTAKEYHTFVWVEPCHDIVGQETLTRQALFKEYYLPKDEIEFYQFCYVDNTGQVRGASTPFCFRNPAEQSLESSPEDDLLVITTQEQVEQSLREKAEMEKELDQIKAENETLKGALQREYQQAASLKGQNDQKEKERAELVNELHQTKQQNENLRRDLQEQLKETKRLKEELSLQLTKQMEIQQGSITEKRERSLSRSSEEKYDRAVMKINQLKEERDKLKEGIDAQSEELSKVAAKVRERERELFNAKDRIQLIQVDLQSSEKEKERLAAELRRLQSLTNDMDKVQKANQELCRKLSVHETQPSPPHDLKGQCETLRRELQETKAKLAAEKEENKNSKSRSEYLNRELQQVREQLENMIMSLDDEKRKSSKFELQISEMTEMMADNNILLEDKEKQVQLMRREKEELVREIQSLNDDIKGLRQLYSEPPASPVDSLRLQSANSPPSADNSNTSLQQEHVYETIEIQEEEVLVCRHCQESFPGITREELEQHEQSHRVCPFCTIICDNMEQSLFEDHVYSH